MQAEINAAHAMSPTGAPPSIDPAPYRASYMQNIGNPAIGKIAADLANNDRGTFGMAELSNQRADHERNAFLAGEEAANNAVNRWATINNSFYGGAGRLPVANRGGSTLAQMLMSQQGGASSARAQRLGVMDRFKTVGNALMSNAGEILPYAGSMAKWLWSHISPRSHGGSVVTGNDYGEYEPYTSGPEMPGWAGMTEESGYY